MGREVCGGATNRAMVAVATTKEGGYRMKDGRKSYIGRIKNQGSQVVQAPIQTTPKKSGTVKTGRDLRTGRK